MVTKDEEIALLKRERDMYRDAYSGNLKVLTSWMSAYHELVERIRDEEV